jgi:2-polyprenyl-3-methyl-5-hydroxy-6-metoxy-1,4-benzoquinol methylase
MEDPADRSRSHAFGQRSALSPVDRFGVWLSGRRIRHETGHLRGKRVVDVGCGFNATFARSIINEVEAVTLVDVGLCDDLKSHPKVTALEGILPDALQGIADDSLDVVLCMSVLEHLWKPEVALDEFRRILRPGGICLVNVPNWRGKRFLEFSAFRLGLSPVEEMDDHKQYYDPADLWPLLVRAGFLPHNIRCHRHKFGLNTFARCVVEAT